MTDVEIGRLLEIGIALAAEKDHDKLLEQILTDVMSLTKSDAGTLYLREGDFLVFKIMRNDTFHTYQGGQGDKVDLPPVPITRDNVCALALLLGKTINIEDVRSCHECDFSGPIRYDAMTGYHTKSMLVVPMGDRNGDIIGVMQLLNAKDSSGRIIPFARKQEHMVESVAGQAAVALENMRYVEEIKALFHSFVQVMSSAIDERTPYNAVHTRNMVRYGDAFIDFLNRKYEQGEANIRFSAAHKDELLMSVWLHDIGKLVTPLTVMNKADRLGGGRQAVLRRLDIISLQAEIDALSGRTERENADKRREDVKKAAIIVQDANQASFLTNEMIAEIKEIANRTFVDTDGLIKPWLTEEELSCLTVRKGTLTEKERIVMENHVVITEKLLRQIHFSKEYERVPAWASSHHEYLNGEGYPNHLKGDEIPYEVRIITILDIFDALTASDRPYKPGMPVEKAIVVLNDMALREGKLDPEITRLFVESHCWETGDTRDPLYKRIMI